MTNELTRRLVVFGALLAWCGGLLIYRFVLSGTPGYAFLIWNLALAAVPAVAARLFVGATEKPSPGAIQVFWFAVWLAFLPNAPYVVTDLVHLGPAANVPLWFDLALLAFCGGTGLLLGYISLADVQTVIARRFSGRAGWGVAIAALLLSGFGIYVGRFLRWNSWDTLANPLSLLGDIAHQLSEPGSRARAIGVTLVYGIGLLLGYLALRFLRFGGGTRPAGDDVRR